jgi:Sulfotransferase domain
MCPANKVFGIGLSRTGTLSLTKALCLLGLRAVHYPSDEDTQLEYFRFFGEATPQFRLHILEQCDAITDTPVCVVYQQLDRAYPGSRFIITIRDRATWLNSCAHWWETVIMPLAQDHENRQFVRFLHMINERLYGVSNFEEKAFSNTYDAYHDGVYKYFASRKDDLLKLDICGGEGWLELSGFLKMRIPNIPFPYANQLYIDDLGKDHVME